MKNKKDKKMFLIGILIGGLLFGSISTYAATVLAQDVSYDRHYGSLSNVKSALDGLYNDIGAKYKGHENGSGSGYEKSFSAVSDYDMAIKAYTDGNATASEWLKTELCLLEISSDEQDCFENTSEGVQELMALFNNNCSGTSLITCYDSSTDTTCEIEHTGTSYSISSCYNDNTRCTYDEYATFPHFRCDEYDYGGGS